MYSAMAKKFDIDFSSPNKTVSSCWDMLSRFSLGPYLFSVIIGLIVPYSGNIKARILSLESGRATVRMKDARRLRNHLKCVHAVALTNLAEYTANMALAYTMSENSKFIVVKQSTEYFKKSRGDITAECDIEGYRPGEEGELILKVKIKNVNDDIVAVSTVHSLVKNV